MADMDDPFQPPDATVIRPRPGAGRRGAADAGRTPRTAAPSPAATVVGSIAPAAAPWAGAGLNPLVQAASPVLLMAGRVRGTMAMPDPEALRRQALDEIRRFEDRARAAGVAQETVLAARYALCASLDEAVLSTPWGAQSEWTQQTLLVVLHREAWGGEKFFEMLDRISRDPARHIDLMELQYLCLALGFEGKYRVAERGHAQLAEVQQRLYREIRTQRGAPPAELALRWRGIEDRRNPIVRHVPWWVVGAGALAVVTLAFTLAYASLQRAAGPVHEALVGVGMGEFAGNIPVEPVAGPSLAALLADERAVGVNVDGGRTTVTLLAPNLFASASATLNPEHRAVLDRVAAALNQVPGRVLVVGHTDSQPLRSLRYQDNFELSSERARSVVEILRASLNDAGRIDSMGVGSSQPLVPETDAESRARNRRVEIVHVAGT